MAKRETTDTIVIHCTQTPPGMDVDVDKVTQWHKDRGFDTIGYHYLIKRDGTLQEGRQQDEVGAHAVAVNGNSVGVAMVGGVKLNGEQMYSQSLQDIEKLEEEIRGTYETPVTYMIG